MSVRRGPRGRGTNQYEAKPASPGMDASGLATKMDRMAPASSPRPASGIARPREEGEVIPMASSHRSTFPEVYTAALSGVMASGRVEDLDPESPEGLLYADATGQDRLDVDELTGVLMDVSANQGRGHDRLGARMAALCVSARREPTEAAELLPEIERNRAEMNQERLVSLGL